MFSAIIQPADAMAATAANHSTITQPHLPSSSSHCDPPEVSELLSTSAPTPTTSNVQNGAKNPSNLMTRAVVANDTDVSNGFVKDGKTLPYVFEANDAGNCLMIPP